MSTSPSFPLWVRVLRLIPLGKLYAINVKDEKLTELLRKSVCNFQGGYSEYHYNVASAHMKFKSALEKATSQEATDEDLKTLHNSYKNLHNLVYSGLKVFCSEVVDDLNNYFKFTRSVEASARVGLYFYVEKGLSNIAYKNDLKKPEMYTIFDTVCSKNIPYLDNNIPKSISSNNHNYKDVGLSLERANKYFKFFNIKDRMWFSRLFRSTEARICEAWERCASDDKPDSQQGVSFLCKSHIAIPITFSKHLISGKVTKVSPLRRSRDEEEMPLVFGVLVADYPETYYFHKTNPGASEYGNSDINVMYNYADIISLGILVKRNYFSNSRSVAQYEELFHEEAKSTRDKLEA